MDRYQIIKGALGKLGVPFDESNYGSDKTYQAANWEFDHLLVDAFQSVNFNFNKNIVTLNRSVDKEIIYRGVTYYPYQYPTDLLFISETEPRCNFKFMRDKVYVPQEKGFKIIYCSIKEVQEVPSVFRKYLEYYLASEIADTLHRSSKKEECLQRALYEKGKIIQAETIENIDIASDIDWGIY